MGFPKSKKLDQEPRAGEDPHPPAGMMISAKVKKKALDALENALAATKRIWSKDKGDFIAEPDYATILRAAELVLAYAEGRPVERRIEMSLKGESWEEQRDRAMESPEGVKFLLAAGAISRDQADAALEKLAKTLKSSTD